MASEIDRFTGNRRYTEEDLRKARLLGALRDTGMAPSRAADIVAREDRIAVLTHLAKAEEALATARSLLPPERPGLVRRIPVPAEQVLLRPSAVRFDGHLAQSLVDAVGACQAAVAAGLGTAVALLPRADRPDPLPDGPAVCLPWADENGGWPEVLEVQVALPCPHVDADGLDGKRAWWTATEALVCPVGDKVDVPTAFRLVRDEADRAPLLATARPRALYSADLTRCVLAMTVVRP